MRRSDPSLRWWLVAVVLALLSGAFDDVPAQQILPGTNVNMVSGTSLPDGDPYLQRQNEPSSAVSTSNPLHILVGSNDYRTVDIPHPSDLLRPQKMNSDAWLGIFRSLDGGQNWKSTLLPGYPQDPAHTAPLWGYDAATDPFMRAGTNGMFYFSGVAFDRGDNAPSAIFVARFKDMNNLEAGDPIIHLDTRIVDSDPGGRFLDKVALATDVARTAATCSFNVPLGDAAGTVVPQTIPAGNVYVAYAAFTGEGATEQSAIMFSRSTDCGATWSVARNLSLGSRLVQNPQIAVSPNNGQVYVSWRRFRSGTQDDSMYVIKSIDGGATFGKPVRVAGLRPFDQPTTLTSFRTNGFQTMAIDATGRVYMAWSDRGYATTRPDPVTGDARVVISTSTTGATWTVPRPVDTTALGHQVMPALTFHAGKLRLLYYDLREDVSSLFAPFVDDLDIVTANSPVRHTLDVFVAQALPGPTPVFTTARLSDYAFGFVPGFDDAQRLQFNPPNLPLFRQGTTPFMGDYIDLAPAPPYVQNPDGSWSHNTAPATAISHAFWTDNRDVRAPTDGDWANYTAVGTTPGQQSHYDPALTLPGCTPGQAGMRNQNIYTARVTEGLFVSAPGNNKPLGDFQRAFVVVAENATALIRSFRLTIENQPVGGQASFLQFSQLTSLDVTIPTFSSVARTVFATSTDETARINVSIVEITAPGGAPVAGGLSGSVVLNPDPAAPRLQNPRLQNPRLQNPLISEAEVYSASITNAVFAVPRLQNPRLQNPTIENPRLQNDSLGNPRLQNDTVANPSVVFVNPTSTTVEAPRLQNPRLQNPRLQNESLVNAAFADSSWSLTNDGNTTAAYTVNLVLNEPIPAGFGSQLLIHKTTTVPAANGCTLAEQLQTILVANIPDPEFVPISDVANPRLQNPRLQNPTLALAPGETATLTLRIVDLNRFDGTTYDASGAVTPAVVAQSVNTEDVAAGLITPPVAIPLTIATTSLAPAAPGAPYSRSLQTVAGTGALTCTVISGILPPGLDLSPSGTISGTPTTPGNYRFTVRCVDASGNADDQTLFLQIDPTTPSGFDAVWNGADTDWSNPDNWSPRGVPDPTDRVYISAAIPAIATLTRDVTVRDLFVEAGATVNTNGFNLTITGNAEAGRTIVGTGTTILTGDGASAAGVFSNLEIRGRIGLTGPVTTTGRMTLAAGARLNLNGQPLTIGGQLTTNVPSGVVPVISGPASTFIVTGLAVNGLVVQAAPLTVNGGTLTQFDNVSFTGFAPEAIQLTINHPGLPTSFTVLGLSFSTNPSTGRLILANDTASGPNTLVIDVFGGVPADGSADTETLGGAIVNWVSNPGEANLAVVQSVTPVPALAGTPLTNTIRVTNGGPAAATGVTLNPGVPAAATGVTVTATQGSCTLGAGGWSCALGTIQPGGEVVATAVFVPAGAGTLVTTASVTAAQADSVVTNNSHAIATPIIPAGAGVTLSLAKTDAPDPVVVGGALTYSIVVTNSGSTAATGVRVVDVIPAGITAGVPTSTVGTCSIAGGQLQCNVGTLSGGQSATITLPATAGAAGLVSNSAVVTSTEIELTPANNLATAQTMVTATAGCTVATFSGPVSFAGSPGPTAVVRLVDMDHDGDLDAVGTHEINGGGVDVWLNNGTGQFAAPRFTTTQTGPWIHVVADFNGDTHPDVISASDRTAPGNPITLRLLTNDGTGTLTLVPTFSIPFGGHLDALDFDRDGDQDLVIVTTAGDLALLRNDGAANFAAPVTILPGPIGGFPTFGDFNGDNRTDAAIALGTSGYAVVLADATGGFLPPVVHAVPGGAHGVTSADLNEDGQLDLVIVEGDADEPAPQTSVALGDGAGGFGAAVEVVSGAFVYGPTLVDFNGDGHLDMLALSSFNTFAVRLGNGAGGFSAPVEYANAVYYWPTAGDVNGDGRADIVTGDRNGQLNVFLNRCGAPPTNLSVAIADSPDPVNEGDVLTYTVTLTNQTATPATGITLRSVLSPQTNDDPEEPSVSVIGITTSAPGAALTTSRSTSTWTLPTLAGNSSATFQFQFRPLGGGTLLFTSGATSDGAETDPSDNTATASTTVVGVGRTIEVTTTADSGPGSLRQAINESNSDAGDTDHIVFNIGAGGPQTITLLSPLPFITQPVTIDGVTQPGFVNAPIVELNGNGLAANGLTIATSNATVRGLVINRFGMSGIFVSSGGGGNVIERNYIGLNAAGTAPLANNQGVVIFSNGNRVGGTTAAARNIISGNTTSAVALVNSTATGNVIQGNYIGLNALGDGAVPNQGVQSGINITNGASTNSVLGNVVSGNTQHAVTVFGATSNGNVIQANFIGTNPTGLVRIANGGIGVDIVSAQNTVVGGAGGARNIISGNGTGMQIRTGAAGTLVQNNFIGAAASGTAAISNGLGISINDGAGANIIGGTTAGLGNLISGNTGNGIFLAGTATTDNSIVGNFIGTGAGGTGQLANSGDGIAVNGATDTLIGGPASGQGNTIAFNGANGVNVAAGTGNRISTNSITGNGLLGINLSLGGMTPNDLGDPDFGANNIQNFPVLTSAVDNGATITVAGTLNSLANTPFRIEIFGNAAGDASGFGEGATPLGFLNVTTDGAGNATFSTVVPNPGGITVLTATAEFDGNTSEFSAVRTITPVSPTFTVTNTNDSGVGSLRQAILDANGPHNGDARIVFNIGAGGPQTITPLSILPSLLEHIVIDGTTQPGYAGVPIIELNGNNVVAIGLILSQYRATVRGLVINRFTVAGISIGGSDNNVVEGCYIGTNLAGTAASANGNGIVFSGNTGASVAHRIGGLSATQRNVISGNSGDGIRIQSPTTIAVVVQGNYIGTNAAGTAAIPNGLHGVSISGSSDNTIGGSTAGAGNLLSGNVSNGVGIFEIGASGNIVQGNLIGTNAANTGLIPNGIDGIGIVRAPSNSVLNNTVGGNLRMGVGIFEAAATGNIVRGNFIGTNAASADIGNGSDGVHISFTASNNTIGGTAAGQANVIAFNTGNGITVVSGVNNRLSANRIFSNDQLGIDLGANGVTANDAGDGDTGANNLQNFPVLTSAIGSGSTIAVQGTLNSTPTTAFQVEIFGGGADGSGFGEGATALTSITVTTNAAGSATFTTEVQNVATSLTATATDPAGNTSEFSAVTAVTGPPTGATIAATDANAAELGNDTATFVISRAAGEPTTSDHLVVGALSGTALSLFDYVMSGPGVTNSATQFTVTIPAGQTSVTVTLTPFFDPPVEGSETATVTVDGNSATATIADEPPATIAVTDAAAAELGDNIATFVVSRTAGASTAYDRPVTVTISGTAQPSFDYAASSGLGNGASFGVTIPAGQTSLTITVTPFFDPPVEGPETVIFTVEGTSASATIADEPPATIAVTDAAAAELGSETATFVVSRAAGASTAYDRPVTVTIGGTASPFNDYGSSSGIGNGASFGVTIPAGQTSMTITVTPFADQGVEGPETVIFTVEGTSATATIADAPVSTTRTWISDVSGAWDNPANWSGGVVPQPGDNVVIDRLTSITVTLSTSTSIASLSSQERLAIVGGSLTSSGHMALNGGLTFSSGLITGAGDLTLAGTSLWTGGNITGTGSMLVDAGGTLTVSSPSAAGVLGRNLFNSGSVIWNQESLALGGFAVTNNIDGVFEIQTNLPISNGAFTNAGRLFKSGPLGAITLSNVAFATSGELDLRVAGATQFDSIQSDAIGGLAGTLEVALLGGFVPPAGTPFNVLTFGSRSGTFATIDGNGQDYTANYTATGLTLIAEQDSILLSLVDTTLVGAGRQTALRVTLPFAAPAGGVTVTVASLNTNLLTVASPGTIAFAQGQTVGQILVTGVQPGQVSVTASAPGYLGGQLSITVTQNLISTPGALSVPFGQSIALPVNIGPSPAPPGGLTLTVVSGNPAVIEVVTPQITVPEGALSVNGTVRGLQIGASLVTVSNPLYSPSTTNVASSAELNILQSAVSFNTGLPAPSLTVRLESSGTPIAALSALTVNLASANTACVSVPATVTIQTGLVTTTFAPAYGGTASLPCTTTVTATATGVLSDSVTITVHPQVTITAPGATTVGSRLMVGTGATLGTATHGGVDVTITSSDSNVLLLSPTSTTTGQGSITIHVPDGQNFVPYVLQGVDNASGSATVVLSAPGFTGDSHLATVVPIGVEIHQLDPTMSTLSGEDTDLYVQVGIPNLDGSALSQIQLVRPGPPLVVTLSNGNAAVGQLRSDQPAATGQVVTKPIQPGIYYTNAVAAGTSWGLAFQPLGNGTTNVTVSGPAGVATMTTTGVRQVVVSGASITPPGTVLVGSRLMTGTGAQLSGAGHGGVTATVTSSNPAMALVSPDSTTMGTASFNVTIPNGQAFVPYVVHGADNAAGTATVTISAPGFGSANHQVTVVASGVEIHQLDTPTSVLAGEDIDWYVQVGIPNVDNTALAQIQLVRAGAPLVVTLTNSDGTVGILRSDEPAATGQTVTKPIQPGIYFTTAVQGGTFWGLGFDALTNGFTNVTVTGPPGVLTMTQTGVRRVDVQDTGITPPPTTVVASRLMTGTGAVLGAAAHGGIDVTITSSNSNVVRVSADPATVGTASTIVSVPNGSASVLYYLHGVANATGTATITISAPGFGQAQHDVQVVPVGVEIQQLDPSMTNLSAEDSDWYVQVGIPNSNGSALQTVQFVQPGAPFVVTLTNSNSTVARLRSDEPALIAQTVTKPIQPNIYFSVAVAAGTSWGLAFDPLANGTTTVTATGPAGVQTMTATGVRTVVVGTAGITVPETAIVGSGLETAIFGQLGATEHGGVNVSVTSSAPGLLRVSADPAVPGDPDGSIGIPIPNGLASFAFYLHALENVTGTAIVTLSATGFTTSTITVTVTPAGIEIVGLPASVQAGAPEDVGWYVQVGVPNQANTALAFVQTVRAGSPGFVITLTSNSAAATLRSDEPPLSGLTVTKPIVPGSYFTQAATGGTFFGLGFTPVSPGTVFLSATGPPGVVTTGNGLRTIVINP
jgi:uncharacterized repeat protein (TIGR01451 family)